MSSYGLPPGLLDVIQRIGDIAQVFQPYVLFLGEIPLLRRVVVIPRLLVVGVGHAALWMWWIARGVEGVGGLRGVAAVGG